MTTSNVVSTPLHQGWQVEATTGNGVPREVREAGPVTATVPGTVHTDLLAAGLIDDPYLGTNEKAQEWIGSTSWRYTTVVAAVPDQGERTDLVFDGLDTVASVRLDGELVLSSCNQHRSYRVPVTGRLSGSTTLEVDFAAPVPEADRRSLELGYRPHVNHHPYNAIRKMACSYGWDWGPDTATSGIWRGVRLESWSTGRIAELVVSPTVAGSTGTVDLRIVVETTGDTPLTVRAGIASVTASAAVVGGAAHLTLQVEDVRRWWPRGYGEQERYELGVELVSGEDVLDVRERRIGFRSVELDMTPDTAGTPFTVVVNDQPVFVKGVNWIPDDAFPHRVDRARCEQRLQQAAQANVNLVRIWGGGIFESEDFYDLADEMGLLVWQDFLLACAAYAEEALLGDEIEAESREAVIRLGSHPSLVILNGNNENLWGHEEWGWAARLEGRTWGAGFYLDVFPGLVAELAPHVAYTPGSPFSVDAAHASNAELHGTMHLWEQWNVLDHPTYRDQRPRFVSEFGWQGPPTWSTLTESLTDEPLTPESPGMLVHQKAADGNVKLTDGLVAHVPLPNTMPEWHWAMSLNQAVAIRTAVEYFRSLQPHLMGSIVWQLNDCWPVVSWAAVDGKGRLKPLWYALRAAYADRLVTVQPDGDGLHAALVNDTAQEWATTVQVQRLSYDGAVLATAEHEVRVPARGAASVSLATDVTQAGDVTSELVRVVAGQQRALWFFAELRDSTLGPEQLDLDAQRVDGGVAVTVTARALVRELSLLADVADPDAEVDDMLVALLPGESATFTVRTTAGVDPARFSAPDVLRSANALLDHAPGDRS